MKLKSLLFGSAAAIAAGTGVQAADLPTVEPVEYVRICDVFGTGFFYIPGTETCLKIGGYVRAESHYVAEDDGSIRQGVPATGQVNNYSTRVRGHINFDARTQTDFGLIRAYIALEGTRGPARGEAGDDRCRPRDGPVSRPSFGLAVPSSRSATTGAPTPLVSSARSSTSGATMATAPGSASRRAPKTRTSSRGLSRAATASRSRSRRKIRARSIVAERVMTTTRVCSRRTAWRISASTRAGVPRRSWA